jgi:hypothetical protein
MDGVELMPLHTVSKSELVRVDKLLAGLGVKPAGLGVKPTSTLTSPAAGASPGSRYRPEIEVGRPVHDAAGPSITRAAPLAPTHSPVQDNGSASENDYTKFSNVPSGARAPTNRPLGVGNATQQNMTQGADSMGDGGEGNRASKHTPRGYKYESELTVVGAALVGDASPLGAVVQTPTPLSRAGTASLDLHVNSDETRL